jgi:hypothetical protein
MCSLSAVLLAIATGRQTRHGMNDARFGYGYEVRKMKGNG